MAQVDDTPAPAAQGEPAPAAPADVAAVAAKAAAAAKRVVSARSSAADGTDPPQVLRASPKPVPPPVFNAAPPIGKPLSPVATRPPQVFSLAADDESEMGDSSAHGSPWNTANLGSSDLTTGATPPRHPGLHPDEEKEYQEIEERFKRFREHQSEVERNVSALLNRLNTQIRVPSSVASSECGDMTSLASSEFDTESLLGTEDGLSMLGSRAGSPLASPRDGHMTPLQRAATSTAEPPGWPGQHPSLQASSSAKRLEASSSAKRLMSMNASPSSSSIGTSPPTARRAQADDDLERVRKGSVGGAGARERGDFSGARASANVDDRAVFATMPPTFGAAAGNSLASSSDTAMDSARRPPSHSPDRRPMVAEQQQPRLTSELLVQSGLSPMPQPASAGGVSDGVSLPNFGNIEVGSPGQAAPAAPAFGGAAGFTPVMTEDGSATLTQLIPQFGDSNAATEDEELARWQGWTVVATPEGRLFFHNEQAQTSQWHQPAELQNVLGDWVEIIDESQPGTPKFWWNELLRISLWKDPRQTTNIFQAALDGNFFFLLLYAEVDGQLDVIDPKGRGALHYACAGGATQSALFLLQRRAEVDKRDEAASTPLLFACRYGYASIVKVLLDAQADMNAANESGNTALHEAASMGQLDCLHLLVLCGANATILNRDGDAPAEIAAAQKHYPCVTLLRRHLQYAPRDAIGPPPQTRSTSSAGAGTGTAVGAPGALSPPAFSPKGRAVSQPETGPFGAVPAADSTAFPQSVGGVQRRILQASPRGHVDQKAVDGTDSDVDDRRRDSDDIGAASSDSSDGPPLERPSRGRRRGRHRDRSEVVGVGLLSHMRSFVRRAFTGPIRADLGLPNRYMYNSEAGRWELPDEEEDDA